MTETLVNTIQWSHDHLLLGHILFQLAEIQILDFGSDLLFVGKTLLSNFCLHVLKAKRINHLICTF